MTDAVPVAGALNEVFQGMYLPPSKVLFLMRSFPVSLGALTPGEPLVGAAFQSDTADPGAGAAAGAPGLGAGAAAGGGEAGDAGAIMAGEAGSHPAVDARASATKHNPSARGLVARRRTIICSISLILGGKQPARRQPRDATPKAPALEARRTVLDAPRAKGRRAGIGGAAQRVVKYAYE